MGQPGAIELALFYMFRDFPTKVLLKYLVDRSWRVRLAAAHELEVRGERVAFDWAKELLTARAAYKREIATHILGQLGTPNYPYREESLVLLKEAWHDKDSHVREGVICALGHLCAVELIDLILEAAQAPEAEVRCAAAFAFYRNSFDDPRAEQALIKLRDDQNEEVRYWAED
jgi:HEAT repeat protein